MSGSGSSDAAAAASANGAAVAAAGGDAPAASAPGAATKKRSARPSLKQKSESMNYSNYSNRAGPGVTPLNVTTPAVIVMPAPTGSPLLPPEHHALGPTLRTDAMYTINYGVAYSQFMPNAIAGTGAAALPPPLPRIASAGADVKSIAVTPATETASASASASATAPDIASHTYDAPPALLTATATAATGAGTTSGAPQLTRSGSGLSSRRALVTSILDTARTRNAAATQPPTATSEASAYTSIPSHAVSDHAPTAIAGSIPVGTAYSTLTSASVHDSPPKLTSAPASAARVTTGPIPAGTLYQSLPSINTHRASATDIIQLLAPVSAAAAASTATPTATATATTTVAVAPAAGSYYSTLKTANEKTAADSTHVPSLYTLTAVPPTAGSGAAPPPDQVPSPHPPAKPASTAYMYESKEDEKSASPPPAPAPAAARNTAPAAVPQIAEAENLSSDYYFAEAVETLTNSSGRRSVFSILPPTPRTAPAALAPLPSPSGSSFGSVPSTPLSAIPPQTPNASGGAAMQHVSWNERFMRALALPETTSAQAIARYSQLTQLNTDFVETARTFGKVIISEHLMADAQKTLLPRHLGGVAGGFKYVVRSILFKLVDDPKLSTGFLYGGSTFNYELAGKACAHEIRGANAYFSADANEDRPQVPIQVLVSYLGFRLLAMPLLPLDGNKHLIYGSADSGASVHADEPRVNAALEEAAKRLGLSPHLVKGNVLCTAGDVEVHRGTDDRLYLLDLARCFPPESSFNCPHLPRRGHAEFYRVFRPEYLSIRKAQNLPALSPDALTLWGAQEYEKHNSEVIRATIHLVEVVIPKVGAQLDSGEIKFTPGRISEQLHRLGINVRHMGLLRSHVHRNQLVRTQLLFELVARTLKNILRAWFRETLRSIVARDPSEFAVRLKCICFLNLVTGAADKTNHFWAQRVVPGLRVRFGPLALSTTTHAAVMAAASTAAGASAGAGKSHSSAVDNRTVEEADHLPALMRPHLTELISYALDSAGIQLTERCAAELLKDPLEFEFTVADVLPSNARTKQMSVLSTYRGRLLMTQAFSAKKRRAALRLLTLAADAFDQSLSSDPLAMDAAKDGLLCRVSIEEFKKNYASSDEQLIRFLGAQCRLSSSLAKSSATLTDGMRAELLTRQLDHWSLRLSGFHHITSIPPAFAQWSGASSLRILIDVIVFGSSVSSAAASASSGWAPVTGSTSGGVREQFADRGAAIAGLRKMRDLIVFRTFCRLFALFNPDSKTKWHELKLSDVWSDELSARVPLTRSVVATNAPAGGVTPHHHHSSSLHGVSGSLLSATHAHSHGGAGGHTSSISGAGSVIVSKRASFIRMSSESLLKDALAASSAAGASTIIPPLLNAGSALSSGAGPASMMKPPTAVVVKEATGPLTHDERDRFQHCMRAMWIYPAPAQKIFSLLAAPLSSSGGGPQGSSPVPTSDSKSSPRLSSASPSGGGGASSTLPPLFLRTMSVGDEKRDFNFLADARTRALGLLYDIGFDDTPAAETSAGADSKSNAAPPIDRLAMIKVLQELGVDINATHQFDSKSGTETTALGEAVKRGFVQLAKLLIIAGADPERRDQNGDTVLMAAALRSFDDSPASSSDGITAKPNATSAGTAVGDRKSAPAAATELTPTGTGSGSMTFHAPLPATLAQRVDAVDKFGVLRALLIDHKCNVEAKDHTGRTALMNCAANGRLRAVQMLIEARANVDRKDVGGWSALMHCAAHGSMLNAAGTANGGTGSSSTGTGTGSTSTSSAGASVGLSASRSSTVPPLGVDRKVSRKNSSAASSTVTAAAAATAAGVNSNLFAPLPLPTVVPVLDSSGRPIPESVFVEIAQTLLNAGADVRLRENAGGLNAVMLAVDSGYSELFAVLLSADLSLVRERDAAGRSLACRIIQAGRTEMFDRLMTICGSYSLEILEERLRPSSVNLLMLSAALPFTPLFKLVLAVFIESNDGLIDVWEAADAQLNVLDISDINGQTALHHAVRANRTEHVIALVSAGASVDRVDRHLKTPLQIAKATESRLIGAALPPPADGAAAASADPQLLAARAIIDALIGSQSCREEGSAANATATGTAAASSTHSH